MKKTSKNKQNKNNKNYKNNNNLLKAKIILFGFCFITIALLITLAVYDLSKKEDKDIKVETISENGLTLEDYIVTPDDERWTVDEPYEEKEEEYYYFEDENGDVSKIIVEEEPEYEPEGMEYYDDVELNEYGVILTNSTDMADDGLTQFCIGQLSNMMYKYLSKHLETEKFRYHIEYVKGSLVVEDNFHCFKIRIKEMSDDTVECVYNTSSLEFGFKNDYINEMGE